MNMTTATSAVNQHENGMDSFFKRFVKGPQSNETEGMCYEGVRLRSFKNWLYNASAWPTLLAKAGFYYTGSEDQVACFSCKGQLKTWESGDSPMSKHKRFFPQCRFVTRRDTRNVPLPDAAESPPVTSSGQNAAVGGPKNSFLGIFGVRPIHQNYSTEAKRLATFKHWPQDSSISSLALAKAGFFYTEP